MPLTSNVGYADTAVKMAGRGVVGRNASLLSQITTKTTAFYLIFERLDLRVSGLSPQ